MVLKSHKPKRPGPKSEKNLADILIGPRFYISFRARAKIITSASGRAKIFIFSSGQARVWNSARADLCLEGDKVEEKKRHYPCVPEQSRSADSLFYLFIAWYVYELKKVINLIHVYSNKKKKSIFTLITCFNVQVLIWPSTSSFFFFWPLTLKRLYLPDLEYGLNYRLWAKKEKKAGRTVCRILNVYEMSSTNIYVN